MQAETLQFSASQSLWHSTGAIGQAQLLCPQNLSLHRVHCGIH